MKIFGIGFHKTGTTSLDAALKQLGYRVCGAQPFLATKLLQNDLSEVWKMTEAYEAFHDNPWAVLYRELDKKYPGSKFILTMRDEAQWVNSVVNHFGTTHSEMREWIYGVGYPKGHEVVYREKFRLHNAAVKSYFQDRENDLLEVSWEAGDGWNALCSFLECPVPDVPFPHKNKGRAAKLGKYFKQVKRFVKNKK